MSEVLKVERDGEIAILTLNRPDKLNALNAELRGALIDALDELEEDGEIGAVILAGAGDRAFAAGADVAEFGERTVDEQRKVMSGRRVFDVVAAFPKPILAAVHGFCLGGGCELALACDIRVADATARFGQPEVRIGLIPGGGGTQRLTRLVGPGHALRITLSGDWIDAAEAHRIGLAEILADEGGHLEAARALCERILRWRPETLSLIKRSVRGAQEMPLDEGLEAERELFLEAFDSDAARQGIRAFLDDRKVTGG